MISFCSSLVALCGNLLACPFSIYLCVTFTYRYNSDCCFSNFHSSDNIQEMVMFLLQGRTGLLSFHKSPTEYLCFSLVIVDSRI